MPRFKASPVKVTKADGSTEIVPAYTGFEKRAVLNGRLPRWVAATVTGPRFESMVTALWLATATSDRPGPPPRQRDRYYHAANEVMYRGGHASDVAPMAAQFHKRYPDTRLTVEKLVRRWDALKPFANFAVTRRKLKTVAPSATVKP